MRVAVVPGMYFKSYSRFTEARIPFETLALCGALESVSDVACRIVDFNLKGPDVVIGDGAAIFPGLPLDQDFYAGAADVIVDQQAPIAVFNISIHTNGNMFHSVRIAAALRAAHPDCLIVFCGLGPSSRHTDLLEAYPSIDAVLRGEPEATAIALMETVTAPGLREPGSATWRRSALAAISGLDGLTMRGQDGILVNPERPLVADLDTLPMPASDYYAEVIARAGEQTKDLRYLSVEEHIHLEAGRGCPFSCTFCSNTYLWRRRYRLKTPPRIVAEMRRYHERYGASQFLLHQQLFTVNKTKTRAFCEELIDSGLSVEWSCFTRSDCVDHELLTLMHKSGCNTILIGVESGAQRIQDLVRKKTKVEEVAEHIDLVIEHGIKPQLSYIIGFPEETEEDLQATIDMYLRYKFAEDVESQLGLLVPAGGTQILTDHTDDLDFDGVQTTTWYTRFFDDDSFDELAEHPLVFPHNHFVRTEHLSRDLLLFVKTFDMAASYLTDSCRYAVGSGLLRLPFAAYETFQAWRAATPAQQRWARRWNGTLTWDTDVSSVVVDFAQFLAEAIAAEDDDPHLLADLVSFDLNRAMLNLRLRERNWEQLCSSAPFTGDDNPIADPDQPVRFTSHYDYAALRDYVAAGLPEDRRPVGGPERTNVLEAVGPTLLLLSEPIDAGVRRTEFPVFRQIEF